LTKYKKYMTEEQANKILIEGNNLYRKWYQIEMPIRQDIAEQLMDFDGFYSEGKNREVKLKGESLYYVFSRLCRLVDFKKTDLTKEVKQYIVYGGYGEDTIYKKVLKMGKGKWNGIKKLLYNCGMLEIVKRTFTWYDNGEVRNGTKNVYIINRIPSYCQEEEYCILDFNFRDYDVDKENNTLSKQYVLKEEKPESSTIEHSTIEHSTVECSTIEQHIKSLYDLSSNNKNNQVSIIQSINQSNDGQIDTPDIDNIISNCELDILKEYDKYRANGDMVIGTIKTALTYMYYAETFKANRINLPQKFVREKMKKLNHMIIEHALNNFEKATKTREIHNPMTYLQVCIFNAINSTDIEIQADVNYMMNTGCTANDITIHPEGSTEKVEIDNANSREVEHKEQKTIHLSDRYVGTIMETPIAEISTKITSISYQTFFDVIEKLEIDNDTLIITVPNSFIGERLKKSYKTLILEKFKQIGIAEIEVVSKDE